MYMKVGETMIKICNLVYFAEYFHLAIMIIRIVISIEIETIIGIAIATTIAS